MKRNDLRRAGTRSTQRRPALPRSGTAGCPANPCPPPLPILPQPAVHSPGRPSGGGGRERGGPNGPKWTQSAPKCTFFTFGAQNAKRCSFPTFGAQRAKKCLFSHFDSKKSKFRCRNHLFHKHLRPGGKNDPKMHFWAQKGILEPKMRFWVPKCILGTKMLPGEKGARCPPAFPHRCSKNRRVENVHFVKILKRFSELCVVGNLFSHICTFLENLT